MSDGPQHTICMVVTRPDTLLLRVYAYLYICVLPIHLLGCGLLLRVHFILICMKNINKLELVVGNDCLLKGGNKLLQEEIKRRLTVKNPKYDAAVKYGRWVGKQLKPKLYFFKVENKDIFFPRGFANRAVILCREYMGTEPEIVDQRRRLAEVEFSFLGKLREYQGEAVGKVLQHSFGVLEAATGSGKTVMALYIIAQRRQPTLVLVHSKELLYQWKDRVSQFLGMEAGQLGDGRADIKEVTVGIVNTVRKRLPELVPAFGHLVVDECHRVPSGLFSDVVSAFDSWFMLGLSATAYRREDGMTDLIYIYLGDRLFSLESASLMDSGVIARPELVQKKTNFSHPFLGEYSKLIKALSENEERNEQIINDVVDLLAREHEGAILLISDRVKHCSFLYDKIVAQGYDAALLTGRTHPLERERIVASLHQGKIKVLVSTVQLIGEGFDCPGLSTLVLATPIKFVGRLLQAVGRVMRPAKGKKALVLDYADVNIPVLRRSADSRRQIFDEWA